MREYRHGLLQAGITCRPRSTRHLLANGQVVGVGVCRRRRVADSIRKTVVSLAVFEAACLIRRPVSDQSVVYLEDEWVVITVVGFAGRRCVQFPGIIIQRRATLGGICGARCIEGLCDAENGLGSVEETTRSLEDVNTKGNWTSRLKHWPYLEH